MRRTLSIAAVIVFGLGLGAVAQQKPAAPPAGKGPVVSIYKSPT